METETYKRKFLICIANVLRMKAASFIPLLQHVASHTSEMKKKDFQTTTALPRLASARGAAGIWFYPLLTLRIRPSRHVFPTSL